jgi:hypothetical protein
VAFLRRRSGAPLLTGHYTPPTPSVTSVNAVQPLKAFAKMHPRKVELYLRHIHEGGAKLAEFLIAHPDIDPQGIDDMTQKQEFDLKQYCSDLAITHQIEHGELNIELSENPEFNSQRRTG